MSRSRGSFLALALAVALVTGCGHDDSGTAAFEAFGAAVIRVLPGGREWCVLLADDAARRERGLMRVGRGQLSSAGYRGMLFAFDGDVTGGFWMRNTPMPLSIAFFDRAGRFVSSTDMRPCGDRTDCPTYAAAAPYRWALEVPRGELDAVGVGPGARLAVGDAGRSCHTPRADS